MAIGRQNRLFGPYNRETGKAEILPLLTMSEEEFITESKSKELAEAAKPIAELALKEIEARQRGDADEAKRLHDQRQKLKKLNLPVYTFQGTAESGHRVQEDMVLNGQYMADLDGTGDPELIFHEWAEMWPVIDPEKPRLSRMAEELGLTYIGRSASYYDGIRIVGKCGIERGEPIDNALWLGSVLNMQVTQDSKCRDYSRCSYAVPYSYIEYVSTELFSYSNPAYDARYNKRKGNEPQVQPLVTEAPAEAMPEVAAVKPEQLTLYGIPYDVYRDQYWQMFHHGQTPSQGMRNALTFQFACDFAPTCNYSRDVLDAITPLYDGFTRREKLKCIDQALGYQRGPLSWRMRQVLEAVARQYRDNEELQQAVEQNEEMRNTAVYAEIQRAMPAGVKESMESLPQGIEMPALTLICPVVGALATGIRLDIPGDGFRPLNLQGYIAGETSSNKDKLTAIFGLWTVHMAREDKEAMDKEEQQEQMQRKNPELPDRHFTVRLQALQTSTTQLLYRLKHSGGKHLLSYAPESDILAQQVKKSWAAVNPLLRVAYDGGEYKQDYRSKESVRAHIEHVLWNVAQCGTVDQLFTLFRGQETNGGINRIILASTPDNSFAPLVIGKPRPQKSVDTISHIARLLPLMQGEVTLPKLAERRAQWVERIRVESLKNGDRVRAKFRMRIAVSTMRCVACLMLCDFAGWLIREIDRKAEKPEWAEGCQTAEEYLQQHPLAAGYWLPRKFQKRQTLDVYDHLADYFLHNLLYYFQQRIEKASEKLSEQLLPARKLRGSNDTYFDQAPHRFTIQQIMQLRPDDPSGERSRSMVKNWGRQGLVRNVGKGEYEKV